MAEPAARPLRRGIITVSVMLATGMQAVDTTIANVALPRIQGSLSSSQEQMSWVLTSYIVASAITLPLTGWVTERLGRRRVLLACILGFTLASVLCGLAQSLPQIIAARLLQGCCGAALMPLSQALLLDIYPPEKHARAMSTWAMGITLGPIMGPVLGGWLTDHFSWRWVFLVNVPVGVLSLLGVSAFVPESSRRRSRFDFFGFASLSIAIGGLQLLLDRGQSIDWFSSSEAWIEAGAAALALYMFIVHVITTRQEPFVDPVLLRDRNFLAGILFFFVAGGVLTATLALLPQMLQGLMRLPTLDVGWIIAPRGFGALLTMVLVPWLGKRIDGRYLIAAGFLVLALALWQMTQFSLLMDNSRVMYSGIMQGLGMGLVFVPIVSLTFATLSPGLRPSGSAISNLIRSLGGSVGVSVATVLLTRSERTMYSRLADHVTPYQTGIDVVGQGLVSGQALARLDMMIERQAAMISYTNDFKVMLVATLCLVPVALMLRPAARGDEVPVTVVD